MPGALQLFSLDASGGGQAVALNQDGRLNSPANPAEPGSIVVVYGTGAGITTPTGPDGTLAPLGPLPALPVLQGPVSVRLFGYDAETFGQLLYAVAAPGRVNRLLQINFRLPDISPNSPRVFPAFSIGGRALANTEVTISVKRAANP